MTPLTVAWISDFPIEWLSDIPETLRTLPRQHPATWAMVLLAEFEKKPSLRLHVIVLRKNIPRSLSFQRNGVTFHVLKYWGCLRSTSFFWVDTLLVRRALRQIKPDVVHAWGSERGSGLVATRLNFPCLFTVQGLFGWIGEVMPLSAAQKFFVIVERLTFSKSCHVSAESKFAAAYVQQRHPHLIVHQMEYAPNWIFHQVQRKPVTAPIRFLSNGSLGFGKGTDLLLKALNELVPEFPFEALIIGNPNDAFTAPILAGCSPELRQRITFKSGLLPSEVAQELSSATIFLLPTRVDTGPSAVKEAVVAGVPVVASDVGGIPDYVVPGRNGVLFKVGDLNGFIKAIRQACQDPLLRSGRVPPELLAESRAYLSPTRMSQSFLETYIEILAARSTAAGDAKPS